MSNKEMLVKDAKSDERVYFHLRLVGDSLELFDQYGRRFGAVIEHNINVKVGDALECVVKFELESPESTIGKRRIALKRSPSIEEAVAASSR